MSDEENPDEVTLPVAPLFTLLRAYYNRVTDVDSVADETVQSIAEGYAHKVKYLAQCLVDSYQVPFEYQHLLQGASSSGGGSDPSAPTGDPRLRHVLCPPS